MNPKPIEQARELALALPAFRRAGQRAEDRRGLGVHAAQRRRRRKERLRRAGSGSASVGRWLDCGGARCFGVGETGSLACQPTTGAPRHEPDGAAQE